MTGIQVKGLSLGIEGTDAFISIERKDDDCTIEFSDCGQFSLGDLEEIVKKSKLFLTYNFEENGKQECKCHKPVIPTFEEIEKEIEESEQHLHQVVAVGDGSIEDEHKPTTEEPLPNTETSISGPEKSEESENDIIKSKLKRVVRGLEMVAVDGNDMISYAVVGSDVVIQYGGTKCAYITIEKVKQLASSPNLLRNTRIFSTSDFSERLSICTARSAAFFALPMPTQATGIPAGI